MRRTTAWIVVLGVVVFGTATPAQAQDGFWVSLASGVAGASTPSSYQDWWFETPHGPPPVAVTQLGVASAQATTAGGSSFFSSAALPVVLSPTDGYAYLTAGSTPSDLSQALKQQMAGGQGLASATPVTSAASLPSGADLLKVSLTDPTAGGGGVLGISLTTPQGATIASGSAAVPDGGWWVVGLGPNPNDSVTPVPVPGPVIKPPTTTPEPATALLAGIGGLGVIGWRKVTRRRSR